MSTLRKRVKNYGKLPSATIRDERLRHGALGILLRIADLPDDWVVRAENMAAGRPQGRDATAAELRNLAQCGYYRVERRKMRDGKFQMGNAISEDWMPQWEAEYNEFGGKPIPLIEQPDGTFKVRRKDGTITDDGFIGEYALKVNDLPCPGETPGRTGNGKSGSGQVDLETAGSETDISGHGFPGSTNPASGFSTPISTTEKYDRDVPAVAGVGDQLSLGDAKNDLGLLAVGESPTDTRARQAPTAKRKDPLGEQAWQTAGLLPRRYRDNLPSRYMFGIVHAIREAFYAGMEPPAILHYAHMYASDDRYAADKHLPLLRTALKALGNDARLGLVCPACGIEPDDRFGPPCHRCRPDQPEAGEADHVEPTEADLAELEAARAWLGCDLGDDPGDDPEGETFDDAFADPPLAVARQGAQARPQAAHSGARPRGAAEGAPRPYSEPESDLRGARGSRDSREVRGERGQDGGAEQPPG